MIGFTALLYLDDVAVALALAIIDLDEIVRCIDTCPVVDEIAEFDGKGLP